MVFCAGPMQEVVLSRSSAKTRTSPKERSSSPPPAGASGNARAADARHPWGRTDWLLSLVLAVVALAGAVFAWVVIGRRRTPDHVQMTHAAEV